MIAGESYAQYATERGDPDRTRPAERDWMAVLLAGNQVTTIGQSLLDHCAPGALAVWPLSAAHLRDAALRLRLTALPLAYDLRAEPHPASVEPRAPDTPTDRTVIADVFASSAGRPADPLPYYAVDAALWLTSLQRTVTALRRTPDEPRTTAVPG
ncbi:hypothetical protein [Streptomyces collinus]|uniref:hypothetical protein n=1 Tax=Streptomyces collinus TaxID=42684 RepID=UPI0033C6490A